ncbi:MAG TPA: peptidoglycan recognition family protein [Planctomycetaceae bacterium]|nr:peptidoglycan recognition family protein [Planctomycetaceae bacterium]
MPASATVPQLLPPEPVPDLQPPILSVPSFEEQLRSDRERWIPDEPSKDWKYIVLHHTASSTGSVESIHNTHLKNKDNNGRPWQGIGYHFVIGNGRGMNDGDIEPTFRWRRQIAGAHAGVDEYNQRGIGIVLVGNFDEGPPTDRQLAAVKRLVSELARRHEITPSNIVGHGDVRATECPGRHFPLADVRALVAAVEDRGGLPLALVPAADGMSRKETLRP